MANAVRVRVEARPIRANASDEEKKRAGRALLHAFNKRVDDYGIKQLYKRKQYYESPGEKRRRKRKECEREHKKNRFIR
jgi:ribosomal protein S21